MDSLHDPNSTSRPPETSLGVVSARLTRIIERLASTPAGVSAAHFATGGDHASALRRLAQAASDAEAGLERTRGAQRDLTRLRACLRELRSEDAARRPQAIVAALREIEACADTARTALASGAHRLRQGCDTLDDLVEDWSLPQRLRALRATVGRRVEAGGLMSQAAVEASEGRAALSTTLTNSGRRRDGPFRRDD